MAEGSWRYGRGQLREDEGDGQVGLVTESHLR